jgi:hypothetical protein
MRWRMVSRMHGRRLIVLSEYRASSAETVPRVEHEPVAAPFLDLVEVAAVGDQRIGGLLVEVNVVGLRIGHGPMIDPTKG